MRIKTKLAALAGVAMKHETSKTVMIDTVRVQSNNTRGVLMNASAPLSHEAELGVLGVLRMADKALEELLGMNYESVGVDYIQQVVVDRVGAQNV